MMGNPSDKQYKTEWSFSFEGMGDRIRDAVGSLDFDEEIKLASYSQPIDDAESATVNLHGALGETNVKSLVESKNLFEADLAYVGELEFNATGDTEKSVTLRQKSGIPFKGLFRRNLDGLHWDVRISPDLPVALNVHGTVGPTRLDLTGLKLKSVSLHGIVSKSELVLPTSEDGYSVHIHGNVGPFKVTMPANTNIDMHVHGNVGKTEIDFPEKAGTTTVNLHGSVGKVQVAVAPETAVRVVANGNLGSVRTPDHLRRAKTRKSFIAASGTWETEGFDEAERQITVRMQGGVGSLSIISDKAPKTVQV
jgi:hypothetical protein